MVLARGEPVGRSLVERDLVETAKKLLAGKTEILLPVDHVVASGIDDTAGARTVTTPPIAMTTRGPQRSVSRPEPRAKTA